MIGNKIEGEGGKALSEMMKVNTALIALDLGSEERETREREE